MQSGRDPGNLRSSPASSPLSLRNVTGGGERAPQLANLLEQTPDLMQNRAQADQANRLCSTQHGLCPGARAAGPTPAHPPFSPASDSRPRQGAGAAKALRRRGNGPVGWEETEQRPCHQPGSRRLQGERREPPCWGRRGWGPCGASRAGVLSEEAETREGTGEEGTPLAQHH